MEDGRQARRKEVRTTVDTVVAAGQLLASPRKSKIWHEAWLTEGATTMELTDLTSIPQSTIYDLTREMTEEGSLYTAGSTENNATVFKPTPMQVFVSEHPADMGPQFNIHSTLIGVIGRQTDHSEVEMFLERNNYTLLLEAITGVLVILSDEDVEGDGLVDLFDWIGEIDARLIEKHIVAVLRRESQKPSIDWEFPEEVELSG